MLFPEATGTFKQPSPPLGPDTAHASSALTGGPPPMPLLSLPRAVARLSQPARAERLCVHSPKACRTGTTGSWGPGQGWAFKCQAPCSHCWSGFANQPEGFPFPGLVSKSSLSTRRIFNVSLLLGSKASW